MASQDMFEESSVISGNTRIEVYRDSQSLLLKAADITVDILARVFKVSAACSAIKSFANFALARKKIVIRKHFASIG